MNGQRGERFTDGGPVGMTTLNVLPFGKQEAVKDVGVSVGHKITLKPFIQNEIKSNPVQRPAAKEPYP